MKKRITVLNKVVVIVVSIALLFGGVILPANYSFAEGGYWQQDVFTPDRPIKGTQSYLSSEIKDSHNIFLNAFIETGFPSDYQTDFSGFTEWEFEGEIYHFKIPDDLYYPGAVGNLNSANLSVTVQLLVRYDDSKLRLIEPGARGVKGLNYYSPNMSEASVVKEYRAFMDYLTEVFCQNKFHIDCWICGNEVNAPDMWNYFGSDCMTSVGGNRWIVSNRNLLMERYTKWYNIVFDSVKNKNHGARVCICLDHCWTENDNGKVIPSKTFIDLFAAKEGKNKDWCVAYHCYPADLYQTDIWSNHKLNPKSENAQFVDGYNLEVLTGYIKKNYGLNHRVMLTEQGFSSAKGADKQAACLVYTYYNAKFNDMVDVFHIMKFNGSGFELKEPAATIWKYLDDGDAEHEQWIFDQVKGTIGVNSWNEIVPNWKSEASVQNDRDTYSDENMYIFEGVNLKPVFDYNYYLKKHPEVASYFSENPPQESDVFWYFSRYGMEDGHQACENFNVYEYRDQHPELQAVFKNNLKNYYKYYCATQTVDETKVKSFVSRIYFEVLGREADEYGLTDWTAKLIFKESDGASVAKGFVLSDEFEQRQMTDEEFVLIMYLAFFGRNPFDVTNYDENGYNNWLDYLKEGYTREYVLAGFVNSDEFKNLCAEYGINPGEITVNKVKTNSEEKNDSNPDNQKKNQNSAMLKVDATNADRTQVKQFVERLYLRILGREGEATGVEDWTNTIMNSVDSGGTEYDAGTVISKGFFTSEEYALKNSTNEQFVIDLYAAFFDREPDENGYNDWISKLNGNEMTRKEVIERGFGTSEEFKNLLSSYGFEVLN